MLRLLGWGIASCFRSRARLAAENICLRQQLLVLWRLQPRPRLCNADRRFWILACRWFGFWRGALLIMKPVTVLRWHRRAGGLIGGGVQDRAGKPAAARSRQSYGLLFGAWLWRIAYGVNGGSKRSWQGLASRSQLVASQKYAPSLEWGTSSTLAIVPQATRIADVGLRLPLRPDDFLSDALRVLRDRSRRPGCAPRRGDTPPDSGVGRPTDRRVLWLGSGATALSHP